jgi:hypothetical protein
MLCPILSFPLSDVLPLIKNKGEATALISAIIVSQQLSSTSRALYLSVENELLLTNLHKDAVEASKESRFMVAMCPFIFTARDLIKERFSVQVEYLNGVLNDLCRINASIRMYSEQNIALARELESAGCEELAYQKMKIARFEIEICHRIDKIKAFSRENATQESIYQMSGLPILNLDNLQHFNDNMVHSYDECSDKAPEFKAFSNSSFPPFIEPVESTSSSMKRNFSDTDQIDAAAVPPKRNSPYFSNSTMSPSFSSNKPVSQKSRVLTKSHLLFAADDDSDLFKRDDESDVNDISIGAAREKNRGDEFGCELNCDAECEGEEVDEDEEEGGIYDDLNNISGIKNNPNTQHHNLKGVHTHIEFTAQSSQEERQRGAREEGDKDYSFHDPNSSSSRDFTSGVTSRKNSSSNGRTVSDIAAPVNTHDMSPPPEQVGVHSSTPTSSQTAYIGEHIEKINGDSPNSNMAKKGRIVGTMDRRLGESSTNSTDDVPENDRNSMKHDTDDPS